MSFPTWRERLAHEQMMSLPQCEHCGLRQVHRADCPDHEAPPNLGFWPDLQQRIQYRNSVRDLGCTCHWRMPPHVHGLTCPLFRTEDEWSEHLQLEHEDER